MRIDQEDLDQSCTLEPGVICHGCGKCEEEDNKMNNQKLQDLIASTQNRIEDSTLEIGKMRASIAKYAQEATEYEMITFLPGRVKNLEDEYKKLQELHNKMSVLKYLQD